MSLYNMLFGMNSQADLLLAVIGFRKNDVERFRDVFVEDGGKTITIHTRTGGGNREDYPQVALYRSPLFKSTEDGDFDSTYADFSFNVPDEFVGDVQALGDVFSNGLRKEFGQHLLKTLNREPTDSDKDTAAYNAEAATLKRTEHFLANGHTFVPRDDSAMVEALKIAEANGGKLRTAWGILPLQITVKRDFKRWPGAKDADSAKHLTRVEVGYEWVIDAEYWAHCQERFAGIYPITMAAIAESVEEHLKRRA